MRLRVSYSLAKIQPQSGGTSDLVADHSEVFGKCVLKILLEKQIIDKSFIGFRLPFGPQSAPSGSGSRKQKSTGLLAKSLFDAPGQPQPIVFTPAKA